ncbi:MAG TPA: proteasome activator [Actinomycetota bacterium]|nr:proteasome activator [Actinomycetota bacterium]
MQPEDQGHEHRAPRVTIVGEEQPSGGEMVEEPAKLLRIASMIRELVEEVRQTSLDEGGRRRLKAIYERSIGELKESLSSGLQEELEELMAPLEASPSESEIRVAQAQLLGWLEGLFHGIQAALWAQQMQARAALEEMRRRGLPSGMARQRPEAPSVDEQPSPGQYL